MSQDLHPLPNTPLYLVIIQRRDPPPRPPLLLRLPPPLLPAPFRINRVKNEQKSWRTDGRVPQQIVMVVDRVSAAGWGAGGAGLGGDDRVCDIRPYKT